MNLDDAQKNKVAAWIVEGLKLSEIQSRIASELGLRLTYMEVRLLTDDLKLTPRDIEPPKPVAQTLTASGVGPGVVRNADQSPATDAEPTAAQGTVSINVDQIARPGAVVSGNVTFSDGNKADWYFDQNGRLGLVPKQTGYRPTPADLQQFRGALEAALSRMGL